VADDSDEALRAGQPGRAFLGHDEDFSAGPRLQLLELGAALADQLAADGLVDEHVVSDFAGNALRDGKLHALLAGRRRRPPVGHDARANAPVLHCLAGRASWVAMTGSKSGVPRVLARVSNCES
jgi:hypothetical protein